MIQIRLMQTSSLHRPLVQLCILSPPVLPGLVLVLLVLLGLLVVLVVLPCVRLGAVPMVLQPSALEASACYTRPSAKHA